MSQKPTGKGPVAYIAHYFPALTQTFVYREILALEKLGWGVMPFSIRRPTKGISEEAAELARRTSYLVPLRPVRLLGTHLRLFLARPWRYVSILGFVLTRPGETLRSRIHGLTHFFGGIYLVPQLREAGVRHFHAHFGMNPTTLAMVAAQYMGIPFSMTIHARDLFVDTALLPAKLQKAKFVVTISEYNRKILAELLPRPGDAGKIHVVHCGIDPERFSPPPDATTRRAAHEAPVFLAVGRLVSKKGYRYLVEAARILKDRGVPFTVQVIGAGPDHDFLARRVAELDVGDRVRLEGSLPQEELLPVLQAADAFVLPCVLAEDGDRDGIPVSLMEAMACGIPCVSTDISGIPELIEDGREGLLVPQKDASSLAGAMERLAVDPALRAGMGALGRAKVEAEFSLDVQVRELDRLFSA